MIEDHYFNLWDKDQNGSIDLDELKAYISHMAMITFLPPPSNEDTKKIFDLFDADHNGSLSATEFKRYLEN